VVAANSSDLPATSGDPSSDGPNQAIACGPLSSDEEPADGTSAEALQSPCEMLADVWVVSTRSTAATCHPTVGTSRIRYRRYQAGRWVEANLDDFVSSSRAWRPIVIWMHGNNTTDQNARATGWQVYRLLTRGRTEPIRFVIWSWPSARTSRGIVRDLRVKADISDAQGYYLAWFLDQLPGESSVALIGYSYGTRVISSGLHLLAGGAILGRVLDSPPHGEQAVRRTLLIAAAQDNQSFSPRGPYALAPTNLAELRIMYNPCDAVLHWYPRLQKPGGPKALGATGLGVPRAFSLLPSQVRQTNVARFIGIHHALNYYLDSPAIVARLRQFVYASGNPTHVLPADATADATIPSNQAEAGSNVHRRSTGSLP
jgi:hypothetical protein